MNTQASTRSTQWIFSGFVALSEKYVPGFAGRRTSINASNWFMKYVVAESEEAARTALIAWCQRVGLQPKKLSVSLALEQDPSSYPAPDQFIYARHFAAKATPARAWQQQGLRQAA